MNGLAGEINGREQLTAELQSGQGTGYTRDYEKLYNRPDINGHELIGDSSLDDIGIKKYTHTQDKASAVWHIQHNMQTDYPYIKCVDNEGNEIEGDVEYYSQNLIIITFAAAVSGQAILSN